GRRRGRWRQGQCYTASCGAYYLEDETMVDAGVGIGIAADDRVISVDPIERSKSRAWKIVDQKPIRRHKKNAVCRASRVAKAAHHQIPVVISEKDRARRAHRIDRRVNRAV